MAHGVRDHRDGRESRHNQCGERRHCEWKSDVNGTTQLADLRDPAFSSYTSEVHYRVHQRYMQFVHAKSFEVQSSRAGLRMTTASCRSKRPRSGCPCTCCNLEPFEKLGAL